MKRSHLRSSSLLAASLLGGCSGGHGFLGTDYAPKGNITVGIAGGNTLLATDMTHPYQTTKTGFSIGMHETNFNGHFNVKVVSWNNGFNLPCYVAHEVSGTLFTLSADNANPPTDPSTQPNPCNPNAGDVEQAEIDDGIGNSVYFYFELV